MNLATFLRIKGAPWQWEYAPMEPISSCSCLARAITSEGNISLARCVRGGYSISAATCTPSATRCNMNDEARELYLTSERDRFLIKASLLWVPDVRGSNCGEWQSMVLGMSSYFLLIFIRFYGQFASNGVPNIKNPGI
jgi:hypothetical protein